MALPFEPARAHFYIILIFSAVCDAPAPEGRRGIISRSSGTEHSEQEGTALLRRTAAISYECRALEFSMEFVAEGNVL